MRATENKQKQREVVVCVPYGQFDRAQQGDGKTKALLLYEKIMEGLRAGHKKKTHTTHTNGTNQ